jgi:hypothetical protein
MELSGEPWAFSDLIGTPVRDQGGRSLGQVFEVRGHRDRDGTLVLDELMVGRGALWQRLRGPRPDARGIPWADVVEIGADRVVVHR